MKESYHVQCLLKKGERRITAWLPEAHAIVGKAVMLKEHGEWNDGWTVHMAGKKLPSKAVMERKNDHKSHRKATDI